MTTSASRPGVPRITWFAEAIGWLWTVFRFAERSLGPIVDLLIRLWLAHSFFVSGILKIANWDTALTLSRLEYPVSWMDPVTAAYIGVTIELLGSILLSVGLATRLAALSMLILSLVIQFQYIALDQQLFWAALFAYFAVRGAGPLSFDQGLSRGLADSALPLAASGVRSFDAVTRFGLPVYQLFLRWWLAATIIAAWLGLKHLASILPLASAQALASPAAVLAALLLAGGLATRYVALALLGGSLAMAMLDSSASDSVYWLMTLALLTLLGPGRLSLDALIDRRLKRRYPQLDGKPAFSLEGLPRVVILGAGFGGIACATRLVRTPVQITLIDRHNYHLFQPLLYQVATTALSPGDIATPVRSLFREQFNARVLLGTVTDVDTAKRQVLIGEKREPYDYLVLATGAAHSYFGRDEWEPYAPGLKRVEDATEVRGRLLLAFESAEATTDPTERASLLTFLIVGGGPTGVELAGAIAELARFGMEKDFRSFDPAQARVILVQAGSRILPTFPETLSVITKRSLEKLGVEVLINSKVEHIDDDGVLVNGQRIRSKTVLWAAGVIASPAGRWLKTERDEVGRIKVGPDLAVPGFANVFAIGDTALANAWRGKPVPGLAPAAKQAGTYVAKLIQAKVLGRRPPGPFEYEHLGSLATIGRKAAVADFGFAKMSGAFAWWLWGAVHLAFLIGARNRISVLLDWFWSYLTFKSGTRLITVGARQPPRG